MSDDTVPTDIVPTDLSLGEDWREREASAAYIMPPPIPAETYFGLSAGEKAGVPRDERGLPLGYWNWPKEATERYHQENPREFNLGPPPPEKKPPINDAGSATQFSEVPLALAFAELHGGTLRYVAVWGKWLSFTASHWEPENTLAVFDMSRKICRDAADRCGSRPAEAKGLLKAKTVAAVEQLARSDRRIAAITKQWDAEPSIFNTRE